MHYRIIDEFTKQSATFGQAPVMRVAETLAALVGVVPARADARWVEVACGPGIIARALAFSVGDATALDFDDGSFAGAVTRFSLPLDAASFRVVERGGSRRLGPRFMLARQPAVR